MTVRDIVFNLRSYANENYSGKYFSDRVILVADSAVVPWVFPASVVVIGKPSFYHFDSEVKLRRKKIMLESYSLYCYCLICILKEHNHMSILVTSFLAVRIFSGKDRFLSSLIKCRVESLYPHCFPVWPYFWGAPGLIPTNGL